MDIRYMLGGNPFEEMNRLRNEMDHLFNGFNTLKRPAVYPAVNIWSNKDMAILTAELPGYDLKDFNASVVDDTLVLTGERESLKTSDKEALQRNERMTGKFEKQVRLPFPVDANKIEATYKDGVLNITMPRKEEDKPRKITIKAN